MKYHYYQRNEWLLNHEVNKTFEEILWMTSEEFDQWVVDMRNAIVHSWDVMNHPPVIGKNTDEILYQFKELKKLNVNDLEFEDEIDGKKNCIKNNYGYGSAANQWFPTMMKTRINYTKNGDDGKSIYDHFVDDNLLEKVKKYSFRHFKRDSFYAFSFVLKKQNKKDFLISAKTAKEWIIKFEKTFRDKKEYDYWIEPFVDGYDYTGYNTDIKDGQYLFLSQEELDEIKNIIPERCLVNSNYIDSKSYRVRMFKYGHRIFPFGFKPFRVSWCQPATNFPPVVSKYMYQKYTNEKIEEEREYVVWDPSAGWGGRILGAMSVQPKVKEDSSGYLVPVSKIHYIGSDPNLDHTLEDGETKYSNLADFYNNEVNVNDLIITNDSEKNSYEIYQCGSEVMQYQEGFQKYKGKVDFVFTSPPYFIKEKYSDDDGQSCKKFIEYETWRDGFLYETLKTAYDWLRPGGYIAWNIADARFGSELISLEQDSCDIMERLGFVYDDTLKMVLSQMPGSNRINSETGLPNFKNYCKIGENFWKYEPIFIFRKPC
jgi:hypothetical protein